MPPSMPLRPPGAWLDHAALACVYFVFPSLSHPPLGEPVSFLEVPPSFLLFFSFPLRDRAGLFLTPHLLSRRLWMRPLFLFDALGIFLLRQAFRFSISHDAGVRQVEMLA